MRSKTTRDRPLPKSGTDRNIPAGPTQRTRQTRGRDTHREIKEHRMAHTHPRAKTTYMTNPKCLNVIHHNISLYILFHAILSYLNLTNAHKHICCGKKKRRMADTHLSIETTYITYPICYFMMLPNIPFRKADAHPLRLNTRCKDLTLVPSMGKNIFGKLDIPNYILTCVLLII